MRTLSSPRAGLTLLEILLSMVILTAVATALVTYVRQPAEKVKREACNLRIEQLQLLSQQYRSDYGSFPSASLRELTDFRYLGESLPLCPVDNRVYRLDRRTGRVISHNHP